jgi:hypothetical protein
MNNQFINIIRFAGQLITLSIFGFVGGILVYFRIPGNRTFTDNDSGPLFLFYGIFIIVGIGLFLNSIIFKQKKHWTNYRTGVLFLVIVFGLAIFLPRDVIKWTYFGKKESEFTSSQNSDLIWVRLELYKNNGFLCSTSHGGEMTEETLGEYKRKDDILELLLKNEVSEHTQTGYPTLYENIGTKYRISNDTLICLDCEMEIKLKQN